MQAVAAQVDPVKGNVAFSSATAGWSFTLQSFAQLYADVYGVAVDARELVRIGAVADGRITAH